MDAQNAATVPRSLLTSGVSVPTPVSPDLFSFAAKLLVRPVTLL